MLRNVESNVAFALSEVVANFAKVISSIMPVLVSTFSRDMQSSVSSPLDVARNKLVSCIMYTRGQ